MKIFQYLTIMSQILAIFTKTGRGTADIVINAAIIPVILHYKVNLETILKRMNGGSPC